MLVEVDSISVVLVELLNDRAIGIDIPAYYHNCCNKTQNKAFFSEVKSVLKISCC